MVAVALYMVQPNVQSYSPGGANVYPELIHGFLSPNESASQATFRLVQIFSLCGHDPPTSQIDGQTDGQTDDMRSQDRALHYSASRDNYGSVRNASK